jgi:hypothetical protein
VGGGLILSAGGGTIAGVSTALRELLIRHVDAGTIPGGVALLGAGNVEVVTAGVASIGGGPMGEDAIVRIQSMTKVITSVAALRLVEAGRLELDQSLVDWLPELADRQVLRGPTAELDERALGRTRATPVSTCAAPTFAVNTDRNGCDRPGGQRPRPRTISPHQCPHWAFGRLEIML